MPSELPNTQLLCLKCFIDGDQPNQTFTVKILKTDNVSILKDLIKEKKGFPPRSRPCLTLTFSVFSIDDPASIQLPSNDTPLRPNKRLSSLFTGDLLEDDLHIWVKVPPGMSPRYSLSNHL
jgi:hypothetical protein